MKKIITVSNFSKSEIVRYTQADPDKIHVISNGIDTDTFCQISDKHALNECREQYNLPEKFILYVGNVKPHKNIKRLLEAFYLFQQEHSDHSLVIVGKVRGFITGCEDVVRKIAENENLRRKVVFLENVIGNLAPIYNLASLLVFPSQLETSASSLFQLKNHE